MAHSSAPTGYEITQNPLYQKMLTLYSQYHDIGTGKFHTLLVIGPPGLGKTRGAEEILKVAGARVVRVRANANNLVDVLYRYRHPNIVLLWDDTDFVWSSEPSLAILKIVADARGVRQVADDRKNGKGRFNVNCRFVFITNKPIHDPRLAGFDAKMRPHIEAMKSRFQLRAPLSFDRLDCFHFACWMATDGKHLLRDQVQYQGRKLSLDACNEVLRWFAENFNRLEEVSPRTLVDQIADYRLKSPEIWRSMAEQWCLPEPLVDDKGKPIPNPKPWQIKAPAKVAHAEPVPPEPEIAKPEVAKPKKMAKKPAKKAPVKLVAAKRKAGAGAKKAAKTPAKRRR